MIWALAFTVCFQGDGLPQCFEDAFPVPMPSEAVCNHIGRLRLDYHRFNGKKQNARVVGYRWECRARGDGA